MSDPSFARLRLEYGDAPFGEGDVPDEPIELLRAWIAAAEAAGAAEPNAMALATCDREGQPHCRVVLLKGLDANGLVFFTNRQSDKGMQLAANPRAAATFWWAAPRTRQVRVVGSVIPATADEADRYFASRPRRAQLCSAASPQSRVVRDRAQLEAAVAALAAAVGDGPVPRPPHWGGYRLQPAAIEFWQGREGRLHDRVRCVRDVAGWRRERLAP
jgi:pyridoxamine 5'-phosphate oxidase